MDQNLAVVIVAAIGIVVPILTTVIKYIQDSRIAVAATAAAQSAAKKTEGDIAHTGAKLETIHRLVNNQLSEAVARFTAACKTIEDLKRMLVRLAPNDPGVQALMRGLDK